jgi:hypothetical protein
MRFQEGNGAKKGKRVSHSLDARGVRKKKSLLTWSIADPLV